MTGRLHGKTAIVMGAGSRGPGWGNGKAAAVLFAREGANVVCVDANETAAEETAKLIADEGGSARTYRADVTQSAELETLVRWTVETFGGIDILDNNVGTAAMGTVVDVSEADWDRIFAINLKSCFLAMKHVIPVMIARGGGSIINISSSASIRHTGVPYATYYTTKAAMNHLTRTTAVDFAPRNVRVNNILPGLMRTPMVEVGVAQATPEQAEAFWKRRDAQIPMGRHGDAWDVAEAALFLASDAARYITGIDLVVDGGFTLNHS
jgi:NAD(P)-dependent dehydrogenase (short-subunit alcohol dehydrogenase family)